MLLRSVFMYIHPEFLFVLNSSPCQEMAEAILTAAETDLARKWGKGIET